MRTLLRNAQTRLFVQGRDIWTCNPAEAFDFKTMSQAIRYAHASGFRKMELAIGSGSPEDLRTIPLAALSCRLAAEPASCIPA